MSPRVRMIIVLSHAGFGDMQEMANRLNLRLREVHELNETLTSVRLTKAS